MQLPQRWTLTQPLHCDLQTMSCETQTKSNTPLWNTSFERSRSNAESVSIHAKHNSTASSKKRKSHLEPSVLLRAQSKLDPITPAPVAHASLLFSAPEVPFTRKNAMFRANPNIQMTSMMYKNEALCDASVKIQELKMWKRSFRAMLPSKIPRVEDVKMTLSWDPSLKFQESKMWQRRFSRDASLNF